VEGDPAGGAAHRLDDHDAVMALGRGVELVERVGRRGDGRVEAEGQERRGEIVVDRLRHPDHLKTLEAEAVGYAQGAVAADRNERVEPVRAKRRDELVGPVLHHGPSVLSDGVLERVPPVRGPEDRPAEVTDPADPVARQRDQPFLGRHLEEPEVAVPDPDDFPAEPQGGKRYGPQYRVQAGGVAPAGVHGDLPDAHQRPPVEIFHPY